MYEWRKDSREEEKQKPVVARIVSLRYNGIHHHRREVYSDLDVKHDHYPQPTSRGAQPHAKRLNLGARIMEVAIRETLQALHGRHSGRRGFGNAPGEGFLGDWTGR